ncbi:Ubiquitin-specific protease [Phytophthora megakarya]|uniref:Ubiquitin-specific protease n=1 Tax=Phytophthora megakarya TaxID=4795 RepID=A0A225W4J1_9STRA|nr:Ubiquitin-specific protease [Phytophthora megakarya]
MPKRSTRRRLAAALELQLREDQLQEGDDWFLVSCAWWTRVLEPPANDESDGTDDDSESSEDLWPRGNQEFRVENEVLIDVNLSSRKRNVAVLKPMLVEGSDYRLVSQRVWNQLSDHFGFDWEIARPVVTRGPAKNRVVEVNPVTFEVFGWHTGLEGPVELLDAEQKPLVLTPSENCSLKELQMEIWKAAAGEPQLREMFQVTDENVSSTVQVCYRLDDESPWTPLRDAVVKEERPNGFASANNPDILVESTTVGELQLEQRDYKPGKEKLHHLLVEGKFIATEGNELTDWRHGKFYSEVQAEAWRFTLVKNQLIDAQDTDKKWYESRVIDMDDKRVHIHYRGWTAKWDEWVNRTSSRLAPLHTKVRNWRNFQVGDEILVGKLLNGKSYPEWRIARVTDLQKSITVGSLRVEFDVDGSKVWMDAQDELLCPVGTHKAVNASTVITSPVSSFSPASSYNRFGRDYEAGRGRPEFEGVVGISNLGNTCFMNSMLQCLINTAPLREYFLKKDPETGTPFFTKEINRENPLGMKGIMAVDFASLLRKMWSNEFKVVTPTKLKSVIGQYAPQFAGYQQQDSQELMNFLLDGLHEDLNRVKSKPYTKPVERNGRGDAEVALEEWQQFLRRNDSIIVDNFMGQLRSHVTCSNPDCGNESITFDPYMNLSVPIPNNETVTVEAQLFWANGDIPMKYAIRLPKDGCTLQDAKEKLSELSSIHISRIFFVEVWNHRILRAYPDKMSIDRVRDGKLHAYELELPVADYSFSSPTISPPTGPRRLGTLESEPELTKQMHLVELLHQAPVASPVDGRANANGYDMLVEEGYGPKQRRVEVELFNTPLLVSIDRKWTKSEIHKKVWQVVHRLVATNGSSKESGKDFGCEPDQQLPYRLHVTEPNGGTTFISDLPRDEEPVHVSENTNRPFSFTLEWNRNGYQRGYDETSAKRIELHDSMKNLNISPKPNTLTIFDCLSKFTEREQLGETDTWYCPKCKNHVRAFKKFDLFSLPNVLIFHLKRFRYAQSSFSMHRDKISKLVDFPIEGLDLSEFVIGPQDGSKPIYDLYAVSEHMGGLGGGHYTAMAKNPVIKRWFSFNDSHTSTSSADDAVSSKAYVLFYIRRDQI